MSVSSFFSRSLKYFSPNCIRPSPLRSPSMLPSVLVLFSTSLRVEVVLMVMSPTTMVSFLSYSTMVACSMLKAYRAAS